MSSIERSLHLGKKNKNNHKRYYQMRLLSSRCMEMRFGRENRESHLEILQRSLEHPARLTDGAFRRKG